MDVRVSGHQIDTGTSLQDSATDRLTAIVEKYFGRGISAHVTFGKVPGGAFSCDIVAHIQHGLTLKSRGEAHDIHQALDASAAKLEKQLRRYKRRLSERHTDRVLSPEAEEAAYRIFAARTAEEDEAEVEDSAPVVAETKTDIPEVSVADAVMLLDLRDTNALFFKNAGSGRHNMVYRRHDGTIGWVEPH
ncbi:MAG: ribosome-associated translation inhibitor RaiA [Erythrobacter sp.]|nr:ribosome-associated translation inhibitor RaiA [Erythrobacter sp.]NCQ63716.1 ribosome-associated translation inhibitor RaiA [Alphaproteobacteria bacterium]